MEEKTAPHIGDEVVTASYLAKQYLGSQLEELLKLRDNLQVPSLGSMVVGSIINNLSDSPELEIDIRTIVKSLDSGTLDQVIQDVRTPYHVMRGLIDAQFEVSAECPASRAKTKRKEKVIDDVVCKFETSLRSAKWHDPASLTTYSMVTLDQFRSVVGSDFELDRGRVFEFRRAKVEATYPLMVNDVAELQTRIENFLDRDLPEIGWENILMGPELTIPLLITPNWHETGIKSFVTLYFHGLSVDEANERLRVIDRVWKPCPHYAGPSFTIKTPEGIYFVRSEKYLLKVRLEIFNSAQHILATAESAEESPQLFAASSPQGIMMSRSTARLLENNHSQRGFFELARKHLDSGTPESEYLSTDFGDDLEYLRMTGYIDNDPMDLARPHNNELFNQLRSDICSRLGVIDPGISACKPKMYSR